LINKISKTVPAQKVIIMALLLSLLFISCTQKSNSPVAEFTDETGKRVSISEYKGNVVVVMFWASWCPACRTVVPYINGIAPILEEKGIKVLAISNDQTVLAAKNYLEKHQPLRMTVLYDLGGKVADSWRVTGIPTCFILDKKGNIRNMVLGCDPKQVAAFAAKLL